MTKLIDEIERVKIRNRFLLPVQKFPLKIHNVVHFPKYFDTSSKMDETSDEVGTSVLIAVDVFK